MPASLPAAHEVLIALQLLSGVFALVYGVFYVTQPPSVLRGLYKTIPVAALALAAWLGGLPGLLVLALMFSAMGDAALSRDGEPAFLLGLASFLLAHLIYIALFWSVIDGFNANGTSLLAMLAVTLYSFGFVMFLWPHLANMRLPVSFYVLAILGMGLSAIQLPASLWLVKLGAALFILSDSILALEIFVQKRPDKTARLVWGNYYAGQSLILLGFWL